MMGNDPFGDDNEMIERGESLPKTSSWEEVLATAGTRGAQAGDSTSRETRGSSRFAVLFKTSFPFLIILFYLGYKTVNLPVRGGYTTLLQPPPESLSGIKPEQASPLKLTDPEKAFVARLEKLRNEGTHHQLIKLARAPENAMHASHPVVKGLVAISEVKSGRRGLEIERELSALVSQLSPAEKDYPDLLHELRVSLAQVMLSRMTSAELLNRNLPQFQQLLGERPRTSGDVMVRIRLAQRFEDAGDALIEKGSGMLSNDPVLIREGRSYYQTGLRLIVDPEGWARLKPISQAAVSNVEIMVEKIRAANRKIHGPSLPLTAYDSDTWSGRSGGLIHDSAPAGQR